MIKFVAFYLRNPLIRKISYQLSASKTKQKVMTEQHEQFIASLRDSYQSLAENLESEESVLNLFQDEDEQQDKDEKDFNSQSDEAALAEYMNILNLSFSKYYSSLSPAEQIKRSKELIKSEALKKDWTTFLKPNTDYQDYSLFDKNLLAIKYNYKEKDPEDTENETVQNFYGDLKNDVKNKVEREKFFSFLYKNPKLEGYVEGEPDDIGDALEDMDSKYPYRIREPSIDLELDIDERDEIHQELLVTEENVSPDENPSVPKLSFKAKFELFSLFNEGWSVRDLSLRYGIMPYRVKAIIYQKKYFFDEVLPNIPFNYLKDLIAIEQFFEEEFGAVDYGVDVDEMKQVEAGYLSTNFKTPYRNVDIKGISKKEEERLKKFYENKKSKKYDMVVEKFVGTGNQGYYLKNWIMHKTRSKHGVNQIFERIIKDSHKPYKLPVTAQARLKQGPRIASTHFGVK